MAGDWTVRLRYRAGLGILGFEPEFRALHVHADEAWIDGWNFSSDVNQVPSFGDFDGDGIAEFLVVSSWGIGVLKAKSGRWCQILVKPNGTKCDGWKLDTADNHFGPVADFNGDGRAEVLLSSPWGIGVFALQGNALHPLMMAANGSHLGDWIIARTDQVVGAGNFCTAKPSILIKKNS